MYRWKTRAAAFLIVLLGACDDPTAAPMIAEVEVDLIDELLVVGDSTSASAFALTESGDVVVRTMTWRSLTPAVATVRAEDGVVTVTAVAAGTARIQAEAGGRVGYADLTVQAAPQVATVTILPATVVVEIDGEVSVQAVATTADGVAVSGRPITWTVVGTGVTVTPGEDEGRATIAGTAIGVATVRATIDGVVGETEVQVVNTAPPIRTVASVEVTPANFSLPVNHETPLQAIAKDADGAVIEGLPVTWASTADAVASITPIGVSSYASLLAKSAGTAVIRATVGGVTGEAPVQVTASAPGGQLWYLFFVPNRRGIWVNQLIDMSQHLSGLDASGPVQNPVVTWSIDDPTVAALDGNGNIRGLAPGTVTVSATAGDVFASAEVTVFQPMADEVVYDMTFDWWDLLWHMPASVGTEEWTDEHGVVHQVEVWPTGGTLTMTDADTYERVLTFQGWATVDGVARLAIDRQEVDVGTYSIMVGGETGYWLHSTTTPGYVFAVVSAYNAGHLIMRTALGDADEQEFMFRMRQ